MQKQLSTWRFIQHNMQASIPVMLLYVVESTGSSPGRRGFFMAVNRQGDIMGSIGGGIMEHKFVELSKTRLQKGDDECSLLRQIHNKVAPHNQSGMICSGEQTNVIYTVSNNDLGAINSIIYALENYQNKLLVLSCEGIMLRENNDDVEEGLTTLDGKWLYQQKLSNIARLNIIGAGHCALALSAVMSSLNFYIRLFDDRHNLNTFQQNTLANEKVLVEDYSKLPDYLNQGINEYVIVMTFGYRTDDVVLRSLKDHSFAYLGVLGSASKIEKMLAGYRAEGFDEGWLSLLHAPAGLPIKSQTPEEIAVSIAAQIIQVKNRSLV